MIAIVKIDFNIFLGNKGGQGLFPVYMVIFGVNVRFQTGFFTLRIGFF